MYEIRYLPLARKDLLDISNYIADNLKAPKAAIHLLDALDKAIPRLENFPYLCSSYHPIQSLEDEYRLLPVNNYAVLYVVTENMVEIRRIVYAKMDLTKIIK